ncbi:helix-turn-helix domain-containing protein [Flavobacterium sp.]|uniref:helix-turn-helix domain-containing protein n=1 Tax=Flavobacterium sp. TaxID=239 RepID=UPI002FDAEB45
MYQTILIKITFKRLEKKFTQDYMASQLGISQSYYNKIEGGKKTISIIMLFQIIDILDIDIVKLFDAAQKTEKKKLKK